ncbi:MAG: hypothetical protein NTNFB02_04590 [Nitrospira sp.]
MNQEKIWDYFQNRRTEAFSGSLARLSFLAQYIRNNKVLNIGVGDGTFEREAIQLGADVHSLDPNESAIQRVRLELQLGEKARVGCVDSIDFPDKSFDAVVVSEVIEHLDSETLQRGLIEIKRVLREEGTLIGTVPFQENLSQQMCICPHCGIQFHRWGHLQSFTKVRLQEILASHFAIDSVSEKLFITWKDLNWKGKVAGVAKKMLFHLGIHGYDESLCFIARKPG